MASVVKLTALTARFPSAPNVSVGAQSVALVDSATGESGNGNYTISLRAGGHYWVTKGITPAETSTQINICGCVVTAYGSFLTDLRNRQAPTDAVNSVLNPTPDSSGSYWKPGAITLAALGADVIAAFSIVPHGGSFPLSPVEGQEFYLSIPSGTYGVGLYIFTAGSWVPANVGGGGGGGGSTFNPQITSPENGDLLVYDSSLGKWVNRQITTGPNMIPDSDAELVDYSGASYNAALWSSSLFDAHFHWSRTAPLGQDYGVPVLIIDDSLLGVDKHTDGEIMSVVPGEAYDFNALFDMTEIA